MEISSIPIAFCVILGNLIICYIIITVLHVFILLNKIKSNLSLRNSLAAGALSSYMRIQRRKPTRGGSVWTQVQQIFFNTSSTTDVLTTCGFSGFGSI